MTEILLTPEALSGIKVTDVTGKDVSNELKNPSTLTAPEGEEPQLTVEPSTTDVGDFIQFQITVTGAKTVTTIVTYADGSESSPDEKTVRLILFNHTLLFLQ